MKRDIPLYAFFLLFIPCSIIAQNALPLEGKYERNDTVIEVYYEDLTTVREFKTPYNSDLIYFKEFNRLTKKLRKEGVFKKGYSYGSWKFYGITGRLKKEMAYDNMAKTYYSGNTSGENKIDIATVDFDFEKFRQDSIFVANYRKKIKEQHTAKQNTVNDNSTTAIAPAAPVLPETKQKQTSNKTADSNIKNENDTKEKKRFQLFKPKESLYKKNLDNQTNATLHKDTVPAEKNTVKNKHTSNYIPPPTASEKNPEAENRPPSDKNNQLKVAEPKRNYAIKKSTDQKNETASTPKNKENPAAAKPDKNTMHPETKEKPPVSKSASIKKEKSASTDINKVADKNEPVEKPVADTIHSQNDSVHTTKKIALDSATIFPKKKVQ